jgi:hypothetical protein
MLHGCRKKTSNLDCCVVVAKRGQDSDAAISKFARINERCFCWGP